MPELLSIPSAPEAEAATLGAILLDAGVLPDALEAVGEDSEAFHEASYRAVFEAMLAVHRRGMPVDTVGVCTALVDSGLGDLISTVSELTGAVPCSANASYYAGIVAEKWRLRQAASMCNLALSQIERGVEDVPGFIEGLERQSFALASQRGEGSIARIGASGGEVCVELLALSRGEKPKGVPTGFQGLDVLLRGYRPGTMNVVAARPSVGKTAFALAIARHAASNGVPVLLLSLEMGRHELMKRLVLSEAGMSEWRIGMRLEHELESRLESAQQAIDALPLFVRDITDLTPAALRGIARRAVSKQGVGLVILDYLQLMNVPGSKENRTNQITEISRSLKLSARECDVPVIALSQLNRAGADRPRLDHLRDSGAIEQDADSVILISRTGTEDVLLFDLAKHRQGATGEVYLAFDKATQTFAPFEGKPKPAGTRNGAKKELTFDDDEDETPF